MVRVFNFWSLIFNFMIVGHQRQWEFLKRSAELGKLSHAYLFCGEEQLGKKTVALEWVSSIFNQSPADLLKGRSPDFIFIAPLQKEIQISQIHDLNWWLSLRPFSAPYKVAILDQAHAMNQEAQNCFLKTLEEPKGNSVVILITEYPESLFATIRSRTEIIKFYPVAKTEIKNYLKKQGVEERKAELISQISEGKPGKAVDFLNSPEKLEEREKLLKEIQEVISDDIAARFLYAQKIAQSQQLKEILKLWLLTFRNNLISSLDSEKSFSKETGKLIKILKKIEENYFLISTTNINSRLALETIMLEI